MAKAPNEAGQQSKEATPVPETQGTSTKRAMRASVSSSKLSAAEYQNNRSLAESLAMSLSYGKEYMDENPLIGEPGNFILSKSNDKLQARPLSQSQASKAGPTQRETPAPTPPPIKTDVPSAFSSKKSAKGGDKSPTTPGSSTKDKAKRRKSRSAISPTT